MTNFKSLILLSAAAVVCFLSLVAAQKGDPCLPEVRRTSQDAMTKCLSPMLLYFIINDGGAIFGNASPFRVFVDATWTSNGESFSACCRYINTQLHQANPTPFDGSHYPAWVLKNEPKVKIEHPASEFGQADKFALALLGTFKGKYQSSGQPFLGWLVKDITGGNVSSGSTVIPYLGPLQKETHYIVYFKQGDNFDTSNLASYARQEGCPPMLSKRCFFNINKFISDKNLDVVGANSVKAGNDYYHSKLLLDNGIDEKQACSSTRQYNPTMATLGKDTICGAMESYVCRKDYMDMNGVGECLFASEQFYRKLSDLDLTSSERLQAVLNVEWNHSGEFEFEYCCIHKKVRTHPVQLNPIEHRTVEAWNMREMPSMYLKHKKTSDIVNCKYYTLAFFDIEGSDGKFFVHYFKTNIRGDAIMETGTELIPYLTVTSRTTVMLFMEQTRGPITVAFSNYQAPHEDNECFPNTRDSCYFDYALAKRDFGWKIVAINSVTPKQSEYSTKVLNKEFGLPERIACGMFAKLPTVDGAAVCPSWCELETARENSAELRKCLDAIKMKVGPGFRHGGSDPLDVLVDVTYRGRDNFTFKACCDVRTSSFADYHINPLVVPEKGFPDISVFSSFPRIKFVATPGTPTIGLFTLVFLYYGRTNDKNLPIIKYLRANIPDLTKDFIDDSGHMISPYVEPTNKSPLYFALYKHDSAVANDGSAMQYGTTTACFVQKFPNTCNYNLTKFVSDNNMKLIGLTEVQPLKDETGNNYFANNNLAARIGFPTKFGCEQIMGAPSTCKTSAEMSTICSESSLPSTISDCLYHTKMSASQKTIFVDKGDRLFVYPLVKFKSSDIKVDICCMTTDLKSYDVTVNPFDGVNHESQVFRNEPEIEFVTVNNSPYTSNDNHMYMVGIFDVALTPITTKEHPYPHWLVGNIKNLDMKTGKTLFAYINAVAPNDHVVMVWKQEISVKHFRQSDFSLNPCLMFNSPFRCGFDMARLVHNYGLQLIGTTIFKPKRTIYTMHSGIVSLGLPSEIICPAGLISKNEAGKDVCAATGQPPVNKLTNLCSKTGQKPSPVAPPPFPPASNPLAPGAPPAVAPTTTTQITPPSAEPICSEAAYTTCQSSADSQQCGPRYATKMCRSGFTCRFEVEVRRCAQCEMVQWYYTGSGWISNKRAVCCSEPDQNENLVSGSSDPNPKTYTFPTACDKNSVVDINNLPQSPMMFGKPYLNYPNLADFLRESV